MIILITGLPGAGKTSLARAIQTTLETIGRTAEHYNIDADLNNLELAKNSSAKYVIVDWLAATVEERKQVNANYLIWIHTQEENYFDAIENIYMPPKNANYYVDTKNADAWASEITKHLLHLEKYEFN